MQKPSIGRIVIVATDPVFNNGAEETPGIITRVWNDNVVNVKLFYDTSEGDRLLTSVGLVEERPTDALHRTHVCWWPPRI